MSATETTPNPDRDAASFRALNPESIQALAAFAQISQGFTLAFVELNFSREADWLVAALESHPLCAAVQFLLLDCAPDLMSLYQHLVQRLPTLPLAAEKKTVLVLQGLERAIGVTGDNCPLLADLNYTRDLFPQQLPHPMLFLLPDYALTRLANQSRDFWAWASGIYALHSTQETVKWVERQTLDPTHLYGSDPLPVKQERIDLLQRLLMEYAPSGKEPNPTTVSAQLTILQQLGHAYFNLSNYDNAQTYYQRMFDLAQATEDLPSQASALFGVGQSLPWWDHPHEAHRYYEQARDLYQHLNNRLGAAHCLQAIGEVLFFLNQNQEALSRCEQALALYQEIGNRLGIAHCLRGISQILQFLNQSQEALSSYKQALKLYRDIGHRLGEAHCLHSIGKVLHFLDQNQEALSHYEQALDIYRDIGSRLGKAHCLSSIGEVLKGLNQSQQALSHYEQALKLYRDIGVRRGKAYSLKGIGEVLQDLYRSQEAWSCYEQALGLYRDIGSWLGEAHCLLDLGRLQADPAQAMADFKRAQQLFDKAGDRYGQGRALLSIARAQRRQGDGAAARRSLAAAAAIGDEIGVERLRQAAAQIEAEWAREEAAAAGGAGEAGEVEEGDEEKST